MRTHIPYHLYVLTYLLLFTPIVVSRRQQAQVYFFPAPPVRPGNDAAPTLSSQQAHAVIQSHLGTNLADVDTPKDHSLWGHFMGWWEAGKRPRVVIVEGVEAQHVFGSGAPHQPTFYLDADDSSVLDDFFQAAREAVDRILQLPIVKNLLDTLDLTVEGAGKALTQELASLIALADSMWTSASTKFDAVAVRLTSIAEGSELWNTAVKSVKAGVASMTDKSDKAPLVLVIMPGAQGGRHYKRATSGASSLKPKPKPKPRPKSYDLSAPFIMLTFTVLLLVLASLGSIALLFSLGNETLPPSLNLVPPK